jgi:hypothetical protein
MDELSAARIRVFLNDPLARGEIPVPSDPPRETERPPWGFRVEGVVPSAGEYQPDTPEFLHWQLAAALERGRKLWTPRFPAAGTWVPGAVLPAVPVAGEDLNAFYDRRAIRFFRGRNPETDTLVHTGESPDIVAHEQGHAVLDAIRPDLWDAPHFEVAAFHEAFGDLASIGIAFAEPAVVQAVLQETGGALQESNLVSRVAEELAAAARARFGPGVALPGALRDAVNSFAWSDPSRLPESAPAAELSAEPHSFCRVFTGACWDALVAFYDAAGGGRGNAAQDGAALASASRELVRLLAVGTEKAPVGAPFLSLVAEAMLEAAAGDAGATAAIRAVWDRRGLSRAKLAGAAEEAAVAVLPATSEEPMPDEIRSRVEELLGRIRPDEVFTRAPSGARALRGRRKRDLVLFGAEYGPADGAAVELSDSFELPLRRDGVFVAGVAYPAGDEDEEDARAWVRFLARTNRIAPSSERLDSMALFREGKSHGVVLEEDGVRRLRRAWVI